jgi:competence protein ComEA
MTRWAVLGCALAALLAGPLCAQTATAGASDAHPALPPGPGRNIVVRTCSECHPIEIVTQQHMGLDGWKKLVDLMATNGAVATDAELKEIVAYLATAFPPLPADAGASR